MKTDTPRPILLKDYRPPNYLIYAVNLDVSLHPTRTRVRARLKIRRNPAHPGNPGPLRLDGEMIELEALRLDGRQLGPREYERTDTELVIASLPKEPFTLETTTYCNPEANKALTGLYLSRGIYCTQCEAQGFRRITYFLDRPDVLATYTVRIEADRDEAPVLLSNGDPAGARHARWRQAALCGVARSPPQALLPVRTRGRQSRLLRLRLHDRVGAQGGPAHLRRARQGGPLRLGDGFAQALDALGRGALRARVRPRRVQHRRRVGLQHGGHGEQGPQRLQRRADPGLARDRHRRELRSHRARDRARVLPQLDRQPHHLPRLVPAVPQGRPHRLPRPGVLRRPALRHGRAHPRRAQPEGARSSPRTRARWPIPCAPAATSRSTTSTRPPSTTRAPRWCACSRRCWGARASARAWTSTSSATTGRRRRWRTSSPASRTPRARTWSSS